MTLVESPRSIQIESQRRPGISIGPNVLTRFMQYAGIPDDQRDAAQSRLKKILRRTRPANLKNLQKPNYLQGQRGAKIELVSHPAKPEVVYLVTVDGGMRHFNRVVVYDKDGRPGY